MAVGPDGEIYVIWEDFALEQVLGRKSVDFGQTFGPTFVVAPMRDNLSLVPPGWSPDLTRDNPRYVGPIGDRFGAEFPSLAVDTSIGPRRGSVYVTFAEQGPGTVIPASSTVFETNTNPNAIFATATPFAVGQEVFGNQPPGDCDFLTFEAPAGMTIQLRGTPQSRGFGFGLYCGSDTTRLIPLGSMYFDPSVPPPPPMVFTLAASTRFYIDLGCTGPISGTYRVRVEQFVPSGGEAARDHRDVVLVSSSDGGATWSSKVRVSDDAPVHENSLPSVAVDAHGRLHVAWYDRRDAADCAAIVHTYWSYSDDGGATFAPSQRVSTAAQDLRDIHDYYQDRDWKVGDHLALASIGDNMAVYWTQVSAMVPGQVLADIYSAIISPDTTTVAVALGGLWAEPMADGVRVRWRVGDARRWSAFEVYRGEVGDGPRRLSLNAIPVDGREEYGYDDHTALLGETYSYWIELISLDGSRLRQGPVEVTVAAPARDLRWAGPAPNPSSDTVTLELGIARPQEVTIEVYDVAGSLVRVLQTGRVAPGPLRVRWDGMVEDGHRAPPGIYVVTARAGAVRTSRRIVRLR